MKIKKIVDSLVAFGAPLTNDEYVEVVLNGLNKDYSAFITMVMSRPDPFSTSELEALLVAQDEIIGQFRKVDLGFIQANVAQGTMQD